MTTLLNAGTYGIPNEDYHAAPFLGSSKLRDFMESPRLYQWKHLEGHNDGPTAAMQLGTLVHMLALENARFDAEYAIAPDGFDGRTTAGKAFVAECALQGREPIKRNDYDAARDMAFAAAERMGIRWPDSELFTRVELVYRAVLRGIPCQCRVDYVSPYDILYDIKTTKDNPAKWERGMVSAHWLQDIFYRSVIQAATGILPAPIRYVAVCKAAPHETCVRWVPEELTEFHQGKLFAVLDRFNECWAAKDWPEYDTGPAPAPIPAWIAKEAGLDDVASMFSDDYTNNEIESV
jgi:hypothetical protein